MDLGKKTGVTREAEPIVVLPIVVKPVRREPVKVAVR